MSSSNSGNSDCAEQAFNPSTIVYGFLSLALVCGTLHFAEGNRKTNRSPELEQQMVVQPGLNMDHNDYANNDGELSEIEIGVNNVNNIDNDDVSEVSGFSEVSGVSGFSNDSILSDDSNAGTLLSHQQLTAGNTIFTNFRNVVCRYCILTAQMQSGKTDTYFFVACEMLRTNIVKQVVIFSGDRSTELRDQLDERNMGPYYNKYAEYLEGDVGLTPREARAIMDNIKPRVKVIWGTSLMKDVNNIPHNETLWIWDESHCAQSIGQMPHKFLQILEIPVNGDHELLEQTDSFFLSVSGTPFSEISDCLKQDQHKQVVYLEPGNGYRGVKYLSDNGKIIGFAKMETGLSAALTKASETQRLGYALVRTTLKQEADAIRIVEANGWDYVTYDQNSKGMSLNELLKNEPTWKSRVIFFLPLETIFSTETLFGNTIGVIFQTLFSNH